MRMGLCKEHLTETLPITKRCDYERPLHGIAVSMSLGRKESMDFRSLVVRIELLNKGNFWPIPLCVPEGNPRRLMWTALYHRRRWLFYRLVRFVRACVGSLLFVGSRESGFFERWFGLKVETSFCCHFVVCVCMTSCSLFRLWHLWKCIFFLRKIKYKCHCK